MATTPEAAIVALADQVQASVQASGVDVAAFVLITTDGAVEYRARWSHADFKVALGHVAEAL